MTNLEEAVERGFAIAERVITSMGYCRNSVAVFYRDRHMNLRVEPFDVSKELSQVLYADGTWKKRIDEVANAFRDNFLLGKMSRIDFAIANSEAWLVRMEDGHQKIFIKDVEEPPEKLMRTEVLITVGMEKLAGGFNFESKMMEIQRIVNFSERADADPTRPGMFQLGQMSFNMKDPTFENRSLILEELLFNI